MGERIHSASQFQRVSIHHGYTWQALNAESSHPGLHEGEMSKVEGSQVTRVSKPNKNACSSKAIPPEPSKSLDTKLHHSCSLRGLWCSQSREMKMLAAAEDTHAQLVPVPLEETEELRELASRFTWTRSLDASGKG